VKERKGCSAPSIGQLLLPWGLTTEVERETSAHSSGSLGVAKGRIPLIPLTCSFPPAPLALTPFLAHDEHYSLLLFNGGIQTKSHMPSVQIKLGGENPKASTQGSWIFP